MTTRARKRFVLGGLSAAVVLITAVTLSLVDVTTLDRIDDALDLGPHRWREDYPGLADPLLFISRAFGTIAMLIATAVAAALLIAKGLRRSGGYLAVVMVTTMLSTAALKALADRPRPVIDDPLLTLNNAAMPSGHAAYIAAFGGACLVLASTFIRKRPIRRLAAMIVLALVLLIGADRMLLGVHTLTDVVAGYCLGAAIVLLGAVLFDPAPALMKNTPELAVQRSNTQRLACILNPIKVDDVDLFKATVNRLAAESGLGTPEWFLTTVEDPGRSMAEQAAINGATVVLVCGGDGTVRTVCGELAGTGISVGVVPAGTGNLLARNVSLPLYLRSAIDVALNGQDRAIDLVRISGDGISDDEHYLVMAGMGFDAAIMEGANEQIKAKVGWLAYVLSGLKNLMFPAVKVEISVDDGPWTKHRARTIVIGNVGNLQGGLPLLPDASIDDGQIDLVLLYPQRFLSWLRVVVRVLSRNSRSDETVTRMTGRKIAVRAATDTPRQIDGDSIGAGREVVCEVLPGKCLIRVPR